MSQDNPEAGDVFVCCNDHNTVYLLVNGEVGLSGVWFTYRGVPTIRPIEGTYPRENEKFLCNINNLLNTLEDKLQDAALNDRP